MPRGKDADFDQAVRGALLAHTCPLSFFDIVRRDDHEGAMLPAVIPWARLLPWALSAVAVLAAWLFLAHLTRSRDAALAAQAVTAQALGVESRAREAVTAALVRADAALAARQAAQRAIEVKLRQTRGQLETTLDAPDVQPWAAARVPADVLARLRAATADADDGRGADAAAGADR